MTYLTAFEHDELDVLSVASATALDGAEADSLERIGQGIGRFCNRGHRSIRLANFCGLVSMGPRVLEVLPKIDEAGPPSECRGVLLNLLRRSSEVSVFRHLSADQQLRRAPLIEVFIAAFFDAVRDVVRSGLMRQYREETDDLRIVRGRVLAERQFSVLLNRQDIVSCRFDELTADNPWNRFVKAGLRAVKPWIISLELRRRWRELLISFDEVADREMRASGYTDLPVDRRAARYRTAVEWARRILAMQSPSLRAGSEDSPGLLFDINVLWEAAVAAECRRATEPDVRVDGQVAGHYLATVEGTDRRAIGLRPDLVVSRAGRVTAVADTKWKRVDVGSDGYLKPSSEDLYQMHAYASAFGCERLALIYPSHSGVRSARDTVLELPANSGVRPRVSLICIDVSNGRFSPLTGHQDLERAGLRLEAGRRTA